MKRGDQRGSATLEAALVLPVVLVLLLACLSGFLLIYQRIAEDTKDRNQTGWNRKPAEICRILVLVEEGIEQAASFWKKSGA